MANKQPQPFFLSEAEIRFKKDQEQKEVERLVRQNQPGHRGGNSTYTSMVYDCTTCKLGTRCRHPKIERFGQGMLNILLVGEAPGGEEDAQGRPFVGQSGRYLEAILAGYGIDMDVDCVRTNVVRCRPPNNRNPESAELKSCRAKLLQDIDEVKPQLIILLGDVAVTSLLRSKALSSISGDSSKIGVVHGMVFPFHEYGAWIGCSYHPAAVGYDKNLESVFKNDMTEILLHLNKPLPQILTNDGNIGITTPNEAVDLLMKLSKSKVPVAHDYEATCISAYDKDAQLVSIALSDDPSRAWCIQLNNPNWTSRDTFDVVDALKGFLVSPVPKVVQNVNMEETWNRYHIGVGMNNMVMDTMITSHVLNCRRKTTSLDFQVFKMTGHYYSDMVDKKRMGEMPFERVCEYNCYDARYTIMLYQDHCRRLEQEGCDDLRKFNDFLTSKLNVLVNLKERGMLFSEKELTVFDQSCSEKVSSCQRQIIESAAGVRYKNTFKVDININSTDQLAALFYELYNVRYQKRTAKGNYSLGAAVLEKIQTKTRSRDIKEFIGYIQGRKKPEAVLRKVLEYRGMLDPDFVLHSDFLMNRAETYRSSSTPNVQNIFKHDPEQVKFRLVIVARDGHIIMEADYSGIEFRVAAMVSGDLEMCRQIVAGLDPHRKWGSLLFVKAEADIDYDERFRAKNNFVFASLYGAVPASIASNMKLELDHVTAVQNQFWDEYHYVKEWQIKTKADYEQNGYVSAVTGFRRPGPLSTEQICNTPIQGPAFHLLLNSLDQVDRALVDQGFKTQPISETHDSITFDADPAEAGDVVVLTEEIMCAKQFDWQGDVPLAVEWEIGKNLYEMAAL